MRTSSLVALLAAALSTVAAAGEPGCEDAATVVGEVAGHPITLGDVERRAAAELVEARRGVYEAQKGGLDAIVEETLLAREAEARGVSVEALLGAEIDAKLVAPTEAEVGEVFAANRDRLGVKSVEEVRPRIVAWLQDQQRGQLRGALLTSLEAKHAVRRLLEPPRAAVSADDDASLGPVDAPVTIIEFSDYECPYCARVEPTLKALRARYGDQIRIVFRDYPLPFHAHAELAAQATECADEHGKFWELHDALFARQDRLEKKDLIDAAHALGIPKKDFDACLTSGRYAAEVAKDTADAVAVGVRGTPAFFVEGVFLGGAQPLEAFVELIDAELARKR